MLGFRCFAALAAVLGSCALAEPADSYSLPAEAFKVAWGVAGRPKSWVAGESREISVTIENQSRYAWPDARSAHPTVYGQYAVRISHCWVGEDGSTAADCFRSRTELPASLAPGATTTVRLSLRAPAEPGRYRLEVDALQEMVNWFSGMGAQRLTLPIVIGPDSRAFAPPSRIRLVAHLVLALVGTVGLLYFVGFGATWFLATGSLRPAATLLMPAVGLCLLTAVGHALAYLPVGTDTTTVPLLLACLVVNAAAWRNGARLRWRRTELLAWTAFILALALAALPLVQVGDLTALGGEIDSIVYVVRADTMQEQGMMIGHTSRANDLIGNLAWEALRAGLRQGDQYVLATLASLGRTRSYRLFSVLMAVFTALAPLGVFALARYGLGLGARVAGIAALFSAVQPLAHYVALDSFLSQASGLALFPYTVLGCMAALRGWSWRRLLLAGLLVGALATFYTIYVVYLAPLVAGATLTEWALVWWRRRGLKASVAGGLALRALAICAVAWALLPVGWALGFTGLRTIVLMTSGKAGAVASQGNISLYPHPGEIFGLVSHANVAHLLGLKELPLALVSVLFVLALVAMGWGMVASSARARAFLAAALFLATLGALHQRFGLGEGTGYPYGYFKVVSLFSPLLLIAVAGGTAAAWRVAVTTTAPRSWLAGSCAALVVTSILGVSTLHVVRQWAPLAVWRLGADRPVRELQALPALLPPLEPILLADTGWPGRGWTIYMANQRAVFDRRRSPGYLMPVEARSPRLLNYALVARVDSFDWKPGEPWGRPDQTDVLWANSRYTLLRRRDGALADLRFSHLDSRVDLGRPLRIGVDRSLSLSGDGVAGGSFSQTLDWCPDALELALSLPRPARLHVRGGSGDGAQSLEVGSHVIRLDVVPEMELSLEPADPDARVWGLKAIGPVCDFNEACAIR